MKTKPKTIKKNHTRKVKAWAVTKNGKDLLNASNTVYNMIFKSKVIAKSYGCNDYNYKVVPVTITYTI